jgi:hypothetical protein
MEPVENPYLKIRSVQQMLGKCFDTLLETKTREIAGMGTIA